MLNNILATMFIVLMLASMVFAIKIGLNKCEPYDGVSEYRECIGI